MPGSGDIANVYPILRALMSTVKFHPSDVAGSHCKHDLYQLKCWLDEHYAELPQVAGEEIWEQQRIIQRLRKV